MSSAHRPSGAQRSRRGMTLLELIVALTITGMGLTAGAVAFGSLSDARERAEARADVLTHQARVRGYLEDALAGARLTIEEDAIVFRGLDAVHPLRDEELPDDELTVLTAAPFGDDREVVVRLFVDRDTATVERGLVAESSPRFRGDRVQRIELWPEVAGLDVRYLSGVFGGTAQWLPSWVSTSVLPSAVRVTLVAAHGDTLPRLLALPLTVPMAALR